jgi:PadR family transcriptional regulator, regulatory protein AphA
MERKLTTTSYAILGLLAIQPWSTYELARQMRRNLHFFWPRAESKLYAEPKRLVEDGLADARSEPVGRRRRTVYSLTPKGRQALERWLAEPAGESRLECETLVKLMFAPYGSKDDLLAHLRRFLEEQELKRDQLRAIFEPYVAGADPFPERTHVNVLCARLIWSYAEIAANWAEWAIDELERWPDVTHPTDREALMQILGTMIAGNPAT